MKTLALAWRNLLRNRRRSLATLSAMMLGLVTVLLFGGYIKDLNYGLQTDFVQLSGHLQVQHRDYHLLGSGNPGAYGVKQHERVLAALKNDPELAPMLVVATPILQFGALAGNAAAGVTRTVYVTGTVVDDQNRMRQWNEHGFPTLAKHNSLSGTPPDTVVIGTGVARVLQLCGPLKVPDCPTVAPDAGPGGGAALPDDIGALAGSTQPAATAATATDARPRIEILAASARGAPNVAAVSVLAAEFQGIKEFDDVHVAMHLPQAQQLVFGNAPPQVTAIALQLHSTAQLEAARERIQALMAASFADQPLTAIDFAQLNPFYEQALSMFAAIFGFIAVLIGSIVLFTVGNTMSTAVVERTAEIGTLRAIGLRQGGIRSLFVCEGLLLGCFGAVLGSGAALLLAAAINGIGLTWTPPGRVEPIELAVRVAGEPAMVIGSALGLVVVGVLSALWPATRASRLNIVEALRHV